MDLDNLTKSANSFVGTSFTPSLPPPPSEIRRAYADASDLECKDVQINLSDGYMKRFFHGGMKEIILAFK